MTELERLLPGLRDALAKAEQAEGTVREELTTLQTDLVARERALSQAAESERQALRALDQAEAADSRD